MDKLIITVAGDSRTSYPHNHLCPTQEDIPGVARQYIDAVNAGVLGHYVDDIKLPDTLHVAFLRSMYAHAKIKSIDTSEASHAPGVVAVLTA